MKSRLPITFSHRSSNHFEILHRVRQWYCRALYKITNRLDNWNGCYRRMRFREMSFGWTFYIVKHPRAPIRRTVQGPYGPLVRCPIGPKDWRPVMHLVRIFNLTFKNFITECLISSMCFATPHDHVNTVQSAGPSPWWIRWYYDLRTHFFKLYHFRIYLHFSYVINMPVVSLKSLISSGEFTFTFKLSISSSQYIHRIP